MRRLGSLSRISQDKGLVTIEDEPVPEIGETVVDETLAEVGTVVDIIGPVEAPYAVIDPNSAVELTDLLGATVYLR